MSPLNVALNVGTLLFGVVWLAPGIVGAKAFIGYSLAQIVSGATY